MVHFKDAGLIDARDAIGACVTPRPEDHNLVKAFGKSITEGIIDESCSAKDAAHGAGKLPVSQCEKGSSNAGKAQQLDDRGPKRVLQEATGEAVFEETVFLRTI
jgi:hypothetical protein